MTKTQQLLTGAFELGFPVSGIIPAQKPETLERFFQWLDEGKHAGMSYLANRREAYADPNRVLDGAKRLVVLAWPYLQNTSEPLNANNGTTASNGVETGNAILFRVPPNSGHNPGKLYGTVAPYACGRDYHVVLREKLKRLTSIHRGLFPQDRCRGCVDTAPILEKDAAVSAGLGTVGWNTCLYCGCWGSRVCLAVLLSTAMLDCVRFDGKEFSAVPSERPERGADCKECRRCLKACPTGALSNAGLDGRRCLNYWLIENRDEIPEEIQKKIGALAFGCDVCQQVCPRNPPLEPGYLDLERVLALTEDEFQRLFSDSPLSRCSLTSLKRNAQIAVKAQRTQSDELG